MIDDPNQKSDLPAEADETAKEGDRKEEAVVEATQTAEENPETQAETPDAPSDDVSKEAEQTETTESTPGDSTQVTEALSEDKEDPELEEAKKVLNENNPDDPAKWYIVHTYSGHENKVAKSIKQRVQSLGFENRIFDIIVPTRNTIKVSQGKKETVKEKIFPGYVLVKMVLTDESWLLVRTTQGVTAFIGAGNKPTPISEKEVEAIQKFMNAEEPLYKATFSIGEAVKIVDGPFSDFLGTIDNIDEARGKLKVLVSIFGRETPVELDFLQVNKL